MSALTKEQIENRLTMLEKMMATADSKSLPSLNATYQKLLDKLVEYDLSGK